MEYYICKSEGIYLGPEVVQQHRNELRHIHLIARVVYNRLEQKREAGVQHLLA